MRKLLLVLVVSILVTSCDAGGLYIVEYLDAGDDASECEVDAAPNPLGQDAEAMQSPCAPVHACEQKDGNCPP